MNRAVRFRILQRDNFTCQYCGRRAPDVVLEIDHINPRAKGGRDRATNLITACYDCNHGKRDSLLSAEQVEVFTARFPVGVKAAQIPKHPRALTVRKPLRRPQRGIRVALINGGTLVGYRLVDKLPVSRGFHYVGPDTYLARFICAECGFLNEYEGDGCGCDRSPARGYEGLEMCTDCGEEEAYDDGICEACLETRYEERV